MTGSRTPDHQRVGFKRHLRPETVADDAVYLHSETGVTALRGAGIEALAPLLDGTRDLPTLLREVPSGVTPEQVGELMVGLAEAGLLTVHVPDLPATTRTTRQLAYWDASGLDALTAADRVAGTAVRLVTVGDVDADAASAALAHAGLTVSSGAAVDLAIVLCDDYLAPRLAELDAEHRAAGLPYLLAKPGGVRMWLGPFFDPAGRPCWHCLADRLWGHRQAEAGTRTAPGLAVPPLPTLPSLTAVAMNLVALKATEWLAGYRCEGQRCVWTLDNPQLGARRHELRARPQCHVCGDPDLMRRRSWQPVALRPRRRATGSGGGHRALPPEEVLARYRHLVSPVTGVIKEISRDERGPAFFNSYRSGPNIAAGRAGEGPRSPLRTENGGKGVSALHAEVGALCEALERHSGQFHGDEARVRASLRALGADAVHPNDCQLYDERQFRDRERWNAEHGAFQHVCAPFDEDAVLDWSPVWSLTERRHRLLPTSMLYFGAPTGGADLARADANGNAAGASPEDAVLQGLLELVERDAVAIWWYNRTPVPGVDLDDFGDLWTEELLEVYAALGREVWVLDVSADLGVPVMAALSRRVDAPHEDIMLGFGAHPDARIALRRALTELNQMMPAVAGRRPVDVFTELDRDASEWWQHATVLNQPHLLPDRHRAPRTRADYPRHRRTDLHEEVLALQRTIEAAGLELLVLDQTRPDIGLPVVKVIVPGLRHFWARFGPGRLFDVPVRLGRLPRPTAYEDLNPIPMFL
ncbi:MAG TPA: TOMM precursor leader peptide-binding protein [Pseudonocardiaceae bacterium]